jgi:hypothetical protein
MHDTDDHSLVGPTMYRRMAIRAAVHAAQSEHPQRRARFMSAASP